MIAFFFPLLLILLGIVLVAVVIIRHFPQAASIDLESLPAEQEAAMKAALMERRLKRKMLNLKNRIVPAFRRIGQWFQKRGKNFHSRIAQMEQKYRQRPKALTAEQQEDVRQKLRTLQEAATEHAEQEQWSEAENKFIEMLSWDPKNADAYFGLAEVFLSRKQYQQASETFAYLLKLISMQESGEDIPSAFSSASTSSQITEAHFDYAVTLQILQKMEEARKQVNIAVSRDPKNPKYLDKAVELSILLGDKAGAKELLDRLTEVNPDNQKLDSLKDQVRQL